ncbi:hypothetical protein IH824_15605 [candidate division KSB1 bacterium]|nr:hypothetical protein [candidate division KSB1 bacterium]
MLYQLSEKTLVHLEVFNQLGQKIRSLVRGEVKNAGQHQVAWYGVDDSGTAVASRVYTCRLRAGGMSNSKRMVLIR